LNEELCGVCRRGCAPGSVDQKRCLADPRLNLGSGEMLKADHINYDMTEFQRGDLCTDVIGRIEVVADILPAGVFAGILSSHVVEHFRPPGAKKMLQDCFALLRHGGLLILEGPDVLGMYRHYSDDISGLIRGLYGNQPHVDKWGDEWSHRWGYTKETAAELMTSCGFRVVHVGHGRTHGMGNRDFRVEGVKP